MHPDDLVGAVGGGGDARDGDGGGVGGEDGVGRAVLVELLEELELEGFALGGGLDDEVGAVEFGEAADRGEATLADAPRELLLDAGFAGLRALDADVGEEDLVAYGGGDLRDARAHLARSEYADRLDVVERDAHPCRSLPRLGGRVWCAESALDRQGACTLRGIEALYGIARDGRCQGVEGGVYSQLLVARPASFQPAPGSPRWGSCLRGR